MELKHKTGNGVRPLFEDVESEPPPADKVTSGDRKANMMVERELLSLDLSTHPLDFSTLNRVTRMKDLHSIPAGKKVKIVGSVIRYQTPPTRNGNRVVYVIMEDGTGVADVTVFGDVQDKPISSSAMRFIEILRILAILLISSYRLLIYIPLAIIL